MRMRAGTEDIELILDNGTHIWMQVPPRIMDEIAAILEATMRGGNVFDVFLYKGVTASYLGRGITTINMARVVGWQ